MNLRARCELAIACACVCLTSLHAQQPPAPIPLEKEPHHQLLFHNKDFLAFRVKMPPGDTLLLHRHAYDEAALTVSSGTTVAVFPGKPEVHQTDVPATIRFHHSGTVHQIRNLTDAPYYLHYSISLLHPQKNVHSLCAAADDGGPINCPTAQNNADSGVFVEPQYETNQFRAEIMRIGPHRSASVADRNADTFLVAVEEVRSVEKSETKEVLRPGDFLWVPHTSDSRQVRNGGDHEARVVLFRFKP